MSPHTHTHTCTPPYLCPDRAIPFTSAHVRLECQITFAANHIIHQRQTYSLIHSLAGDRGSSCRLFCFRRLIILFYFYHAIALVLYGKRVPLLYCCRSRGATASVFCFRVGPNHLGYHKSCWRLVHNPLRCNRPRLRTLSH